MIIPKAWGGTAILSWGANTESDLAGYKVYYGQSRPYSQSLDVGNITSYTVGGLAEGLTYYFVVTAYNTSGYESGYSNEVSKTIPDVTAPLLSSIAAGAVSASSATISWLSNEPATSQVEYGLTTAYGASSPLDTTLLTSHRVTLTSLTPSTLYHYRVHSRDAAGNSAVSADRTFTTASPDTTPPIISAVAASRVTATGATITWTTNEPSDSRVEYGPTTTYGNSTPLNITLVTSHSMTLSGLTASTTYHFRVTSRDAAGNVAVSGDSTFMTATATLSRLSNFSTRALVQTGEQVLIGGVIIGGTTPKTVLIRGLGPTLTDFGVPGALADPLLQLYSGGTVIAQNNDWQVADPLCATSGYVCGNAAQITATGLDPCVGVYTNCARESALLITLPPGAYTASLRGVNNGTGVGLIGVDDVDTNQTTTLVNISTRALVGTGTDAAVGGFIISGSSNKQVLIRGFGPTLSSFGVSGALGNPTLELSWDDDSNPLTPPLQLAVNDNWGTPAAPCNAPVVACGTPQDIANTGMSADTYAPTNPNRALDAALLVTLPPGLYTVSLSGVSNGTGVGLIGVDAVGP